MASLGRFELPTYRLGGGCSIHLSYRDAAYCYSIVRSLAAHGISAAGSPLATLGSHPLIAST